MAHVQDMWTKPAGVDGRGRPKREPSEQWGTGKRWRAVWEDRPGHRATRLFDTRDAAVAHLARVHTDKADGRYIAARRDRTKVGDLWPTWRATKTHLRGTTLDGYDAIWRARLADRWAAVPVRDVHRHDVDLWVAGLDVSTGRRRAIVQLFSAVMDSAVERRMLPANPLRGGRRPAPQRREMRALTAPEVRALAAAMTPHDLEIWVLALTGIRWGEMVGLQVRDLDPGRERLRVARGYVEVDRVGAMLQPTKTGRGRDVPVAGDLLARLTRAAADRAPLEPLLVGPTFTGWTHTLWRRRWARAVATAGVPGVTTHMLRHTAASLAIAAGADVKVVQGMLGHASATMTLDLYGHLLDRSLDDVGARLAEQFRDER